MMHGPYLLGAALIYVKTCELCPKHITSRSQGLSVWRLWNLEVEEFFTECRVVLVHPTGKWDLD